MSTDNKEFFDLLNTIADEQVFDLELTNGNVVQCKQLTTSMLKDLVKAVVDSPITQVTFNTAASNVLISSLTSPVSEEELNLIDRTLFILDTRSNSLSPTINISNNDKTVEADLSKISSNIRFAVKSNKDCFENKTVTIGKLTLTFGVPLVKAESQLNQEIYKQSETLEVQDTEELRKIIGEAFINEIAKTLQTAAIDDKVLDFKTTTFKSRIKTIESLPAAAIQEVIKYIETYKKLVEDCLVVEGVTVPIDGSLFSLR